MINEDIQVQPGEEPPRPETKYTTGAHKLNEFNWLADLPFDARITMWLKSGSRIRAKVSTAM